MVPAKKPPMLKSEKLTKEMNMLEFENYFVYPSPLDFIAIYIYIYMHVHVGDFF